MATNRIEGVEARGLQIESDGYRLALEIDPSPNQDQSFLRAAFDEHVRNLLGEKSERKITLKRLPKDLKWMGGYDQTKARGPVEVTVASREDKRGFSWRMREGQFELGLHQIMPFFTNNGEEQPLSEDIFWNWKIVLARCNQLASQVALAAQKQ